MHLETNRLLFEWGYERALLAVSARNRNNWRLVQSVIYVHSYAHRKKVNTFF